MREHQHRRALSSISLLLVLGLRAGGAAAQLDKFNAVGLPGSRDRRGQVGTELTDKGNVTIAVPEGKQHTTGRL